MTWFCKNSMIIKPIFNKINNFNNGLSSKKIKKLSKYKVIILKRYYAQFKSWSWIWLKSLTEYGPIR